METILVVEDDAALRLSLVKTLRSEGYRVLTASRGDEGLQQALAEPPDVVLLDVMMPGMNGFEVCQELRQRLPELPILMVTAKAEEADIVRGLGLGADDYIAKPFGVAELLARVAAALRKTRLRRTASASIGFGEVTVHFERHEAQRNGKAVELTAQEMKLLRFLIEHESELLPRQRIIDAVWGADYFGTDRTVDNFMLRLREKFEIDPKNPRHFLTIRGAGYRFVRDPK